MRATPHLQAAAVIADERRASGPFSERFHSERRGERVLLLAPTLPWPAHPFGGAQRTALLIRALQHLGPVDLLLVTDAAYELPATVSDAELREKYRVVGHCVMSEGRLAGPWERVARQGPRALRRFANQMAEREGAYLPCDDAAERVRQLTASGAYQMIVARYLKPAMAGAIDRVGLPTMLDFDDMDFRVLEHMQHAEPWEGIKGRIGAALSLSHLRRLNLRDAARFDHVFITSDAELEHYPGAATVLPNIPFVAPPAEQLAPAPPNPRSREVLFIGHLGYLPNRQGVDHLVTNLWPEIVAADPGATLRLVGVGMHEEDRVRWSTVPGVIAHGFAENVAELYAASAFTIAPIYWGGGTKIKVIESLARGRVTLTTPHALHGYEALLRHGESLWLAEDDQRMIDGALALLRDAGLRARLAATGREVVNRHFSYRSFEQTVLHAARQVLAG